MGDGDGVITDISAADFDLLVSQAIDGVPDELANVMDNCVILVEDYPPPGGPVLLGLYEGVPLTERGYSYPPLLPDRIFIFRQPILSICNSLEEVVRQVHITVVHEIAHHFGIDDARLRELGYG